MRMIHPLSIALVLSLAAVIQTSSAQPVDSSVSGKIIACFKKGSEANKGITFQQMRECSGVWVTPRALLQCSLEMECPALPDTIQGRTVFLAVLQAEHLNVNSKISL